MTSEKSKRRMTENEAVLRRSNEAVVKDFTELRAMAEDEGQVNQSGGLDNPILLFCRATRYQVSKKL